jgi:hypothetical protein
MDFTNFALIELAGALEAQRAYDRDQGKWLTLWRKMQGEAEATAVATKPAPEPLRPAA